LIGALPQTKKALCKSATRLSGFLRSTVQHVGLQHGRSGGRVAGPPLVKWAADIFTQYSDCRFSWTRPRKKSYQNDDVGFPRERNPNIVSEFPYKYPHSKSGGGAHPEKPARSAQVKGISWKRQKTPLNPIRNGSRGKPVINCLYPRGNRGRRFEWDEVCLKPTNATIPRRKPLGFFQSV